MSTEQSLFSEGEEQLKNGRFAEAYETFTRYLSLYRATVPVYYDRAQAARALGRISDALQDLARVIYEDPDDTDARWTRYKLLSDHQKILQDAYAATDLVLRPMVQGLQTTETLLMLDDLAILLKHDRFDLAARSERASLLWSLGSLSEARADLDTILIQSPDDIWALNARGMLLHRLGEYAAAVADYDDALDECDTCAYIVYNKALSLMAGGRLHDAAKAFHTFLAGDSLDGEAWLMLAQCNIDLGRNEEACAALRKSMELGQPEARKRFEALCK